MINAHALSNSDRNTSAEEVTFRLRNSIAAIQVMPSAVEDEEPKLGMITQLPSGADLEACGEGFNERTVKVRWSGGTYFVFLQDL